VIHDAVSRTALEVAIDPAIDEGAVSVEPIHNAVIDAADLRVDVIHDANDDLMRIGVWGIGLGCPGTKA
jgi:hypothetical protein